MSCGLVRSLQGCESLAGWPCNVLPSAPGRPLHSAPQPQAAAGRPTPATPGPHQAQDPTAMVT